MSKLDLGLQKYDNMSHYEQKVNPFINYKADRLPEREWWNDSDMVSPFDRNIISQLSESLHRSLNQTNISKNDLSAYNKTEEKQEGGL